MKCFPRTAACFAAMFAAATAFAAPQADTAGYRREIAPLVAKYCVDCHGPDAQEGQLSLHDIEPDLLAGRDYDTWRTVSEQLKFHAMPPTDAEQPTATERAAILQWIRQELLKTQQPGIVTDERLMLPQFGNYVDHEALFNEPAGPVIPATPRIWRVRPTIYAELVQAMSRKNLPQGIGKPFNLSSGAEIKDFSGPYFIDEPTTNLLLANAEKIVDAQTAPRSSLAELKKLVLAEKPPTHAEVAAAIQTQFRGALRRSASDEEVQRFVALREKIAQQGNHVLGSKTMLMGILLLPEAVFRWELGDGPTDELSRRRLTPRETAIALSYALGEKIDEPLLQAAADGKLSSRADVVAYVTERLANSSKTYGGNPRIMQFFREYFDYPTVQDVFKDLPQPGQHAPGLLQSDLEYLIARVLAADWQVLAELLTTNKYFVAYRTDPKTGAVVEGGDKRRPLEYETSFGLPPDWKWTPQQPLEMPADERAGVLTHPAWLAAWSGNFDNHPVQRGKWIRTHLLGGFVADVPIGVDARIPEDEHKQLRERLAQVTSQAECWRCHKKMDALGTPFEHFDHYGRFRRFENARPINASGAISLVGDARVEGSVKNHIELVRKLAASERVEQVFVRHVFRFFMGRNETLGDAKTLQDAHLAYRESEGSFRALVVSLLASDSFLYRDARGDLTAASN